MNRKSFLYSRHENWEIDEESRTLSKLKSVCNESCSNILLIIFEYFRILSREIVHICKCDPYSWSWLLRSAEIGFVRCCIFIYSLFLYFRQRKKFHSVKGDISRTLANLPPLLCQQSGEWKKTTGIKFTRVNCIRYFSPWLVSSAICEGFSGVSLFNFSAVAFCPGQSVCILCIFVRLLAPLLHLAEWESILQKKRKKKKRVSLSD